jgi:putative ABC transport system permease protein
MITVAVIAALLCAPALVDTLRQPSLRRLAWRNVNRRRSEAMTIIIGSLLGTAIITAAMVVDDTISSSIRDFGRTQLGPIDELATTDDLSQLDAIVAALTTPPLPATDGVVRAVGTGAALTSAGTATGEARSVIPDGTLLEIDFDAARAFGGDVKATGLAGAGPTPSSGEAVLNSRSARDLRVRAGDRIEVHAFGASTTLTVRQVVPELGVAGFRSALVAPGTIERLAASSAGTAARPPQGLVLVSNAGGVFDGVGRSDDVVLAMAQRLQGRQVDIVERKQELLEAADEQGRSVGQLYQGIGGFSVIAGVLLLVNLFVMLSEDRKVELGMLRAVGFTRSRVTRSFGVEGLVYSVVASVLGALAGIGVGWVITRIASQIISDAEQNDLVFRLSVEPRTLLTGGLVGLVISMLTVWATSARIARLNVIAAIRDLPQPRRTGRRVLRLVGLVLGAVAGVLFATAGISGKTPGLVVLGVPLAAACTAGLVSRVVRGRAPLFVAASISVVWCVGVFSFLGDAMEGSTINVFLLQGMILVAASVAMVTALDHEASALVRKLSRRGGALPARLGLAYPLARRFRTGMLLGMYALIIFTMTFISVFSGVLGGQTDSLTSDASAGYSVFVDSNNANPVTEELLAAQPGVTKVASFTRAFPEWLADFRSTPIRFPITGFDESLLALGAPVLSEREPGVADDLTQFRRVLADPTTAIVNDYFLQAGGGPPEDRVKVGDTVQLIDPTSRRPVALRVVGVMRADPFLLPMGAFVSPDVLRASLATSSSVNRHYLAVAPGTDAAALAAKLEDTFLQNGVESTTIRASVQLNLRTFRNFLALMRGYLALGLLIGIAGLGVVMVRAVRERRREIGMLRAMGVSSSVVRRAFLLESMFIALQGIVLGVVLGMITSYSVLTNSIVFGTGTLAFVWPWLALVGIVIIPLVASLIATALPAARASQIKPAVALRVTD